MRYTGGQRFVRSSLTSVPATEPQELRLCTSATAPASGNRDAMYSARAATVGWSSVTVAGSSTANLAASALRSSTAPSESSPASDSGCVGATSAPITLATVAATAAVKLAC